MTPEEQAAADAAAAAKKAEDEAQAAQAAEEAAKTAADAKRDPATVVELDRMRIAVATANREAKKSREKAEALEAADVARKQAEMTEGDRLKTENEALKQQNADTEARRRETLIRSAFVVVAHDAGVLHPDDVYLLADRSAVEVDEDDKVSGVVEAVKALVDGGRLPMGTPPAPHLNGGAGGGDRGRPAVKLTADEIEAARHMQVPLERAAAQKAAMQKEAEAV